MPESTFIVTRVRDHSSTPPLPAVVVTFQTTPPRHKRLTDYVRTIIITALGYYDAAVEYVVTEVKAESTQTWYFADDRFFAQS